MGRGYPKVSITDMLCPCGTLRLLFSDSLGQVQASTYKEAEKDIKNNV